MTWIALNDETTVWVDESDKSASWAIQSDQALAWTTYFQYGYVEVGYVDPYYIDGEINPDPPPEQATNTWALLSDQGTTWL